MGKGTAGGAAGAESGGGFSIEISDESAIRTWRGGGGEIFPFRRASSIPRRAPLVFLARCFRPAISNVILASFATRRRIPAADLLFLAAYKVAPSLMSNLEADYSRVVPYLSVDNKRIRRPNMDGQRGSGFANFAGSTGAFTWISLSSVIDCPLVHVTVQRKGTLTPATSR